MKRKKQYFSKTSALKGWTSAILAATLLVQPISLVDIQPIAVYAATEPTLTKVSETPITSGATLQKYVWTSVRGKAKVKANVHVVKIDLHNPHVTLDVMTGINDQFTKRNTTLGMVKETGAVAGVNGDYYAVAAEGAPIGPQVSDGELVASPSLLNGMFAFGITAEGKPMIDQFKFQGTITAPSGATYPLAGLNKTFYWTDDKQHSHTNNIYLYTDKWASTKRADDGATTPTEVLVRNGIVEQIVEKQYLPMSPPEDGYILRAAHKGSDFITEQLKVGDRIEVDYQLQAKNSNEVYPAGSFKTMIGGHTILVHEGKPSYYSRDVSSLGGYRARTGIGYSKDERHVFLITVDASGDSKGMSLDEFKRAMIGVGVWKGLNLDGGGSTQLVSRPLGETNVELTNKPENNFQRRVVNGLGVYSLAPKGTLSGMLIDIEPILFIGETTPIDIKGYDQYFNPIAVDGSEFSWTVKEPIGEFVEHSFKPTKPGSSTIQAKLGDKVKTAPVQVVGRNDLASLAITGDINSISAGSTYTLPVVAETDTGVKRTVPAESIQWELQGFEGTVSGNQLKVDQVFDTGAARIIARYEGFSTQKTLPIGVDKLWTDFTDFEYPIAFSSYPAEVKGGSRVVFGLPGLDESNRVLHIEYNFSKGTGTKAAYANLNGDEGITLEGEPLQMKLKALGDGSLNWLRAEIVDAKGTLHRVDITQAINWYGWRDFTVNLTDYNMAYPITLKKLYVANPEQGQDEREVFGAVGFDDIRFEYRGNLPELEKNKVELTLNSTTMQLQGEQLEMDQAPVVIDGNTLVPIKFIVEALGGQVGWDGKEKKATIIRGHQMMDMWIDQTWMVVNGTRAEAPIAPAVMSGRTMVPLRLISETLGWKVSYHSETKSIILE